MAEELTFLRCGLTPHCDVRFAGYFDVYSLSLASKNSVTVQYDDDIYELSGKWFWSVYPETWIKVQPSGTAQWWEHRYANFHKPLIGRWISAGIWLTRPQPAPPHKDWESLFDEMIACSQKLDRWNQMKATNILENILLTLAQERAQTTRTEPWLEKVFQHLDHSRDFSPDYIRIARDCNMALSTLRRNFKHATGVPLHEYSMRQRMATARQMLGETDMTIKAVAEKLGYRDVSYFTRQFQLLCGVTPAAYRRYNKLK